MATKTIKGMDELVRKLRNFEDLQKLRPAMMAGALHIKGKIAQYPPSTAANSPRNFGSFYSIKTRKSVNTWYERGFGQRWTRKDGSWGGRKTSETLGRRWTVGNRDRGLTKVIGNKASYAPYVHDADDQAGFHGKRGWKTDEQVIREEEKTVLNFVKKEVDKILAK